jgi:hypothetical protein
MQAEFGAQRSRLTVAEQDRRRHILLIALAILLLVIAQQYLIQWVNQPDVAAGPQVHETAIIVAVPDGR